MGRINKQKKEVPAISTASLPDIIFILLFFFMVVTVMREVELKVQNRLPKANQLNKLGQKEAVSYMYIGEPIGKFQAQYGNAPKLQLNDQFADVDEVGKFVNFELQNALPSVRGKYTWALKVDKESTMGIVDDVKQELRKADALKISYITVQGEVE